MYRGGFLISCANKVGSRVFEKILAEQNVGAFNGAQGRILYVLWQRDGIPIIEISQKTGLATTSLTSMLDRMEESGLIRRASAPGDRRKILIFLTEATKDLQKDYDAVSDRMGKIMYESFSDEEIVAFESQLERILNNLEKQ